MERILRVHNKSNVLSTEDIPIGLIGYWLHIRGNGEYWDIWMSDEDAADLRLKQGINIRLFEKWDRALPPDEIFKVYRERKEEIEQL